MSKHTPGPWELDRSSVLIPLGPCEFAEAYGGTPANARLIAAAPELLAALIYVQENVADDSPHMWAMVAKAIAAATGEQA